MRSAPGAAASAVIAASRSRCSCWRRANWSRNARSVSSSIASLLERPERRADYRVFHNSVQDLAIVNVELRISGSSRCSVPNNSQSLLSHKRAIIRCLKEPRIEETCCMSMQSHLAELEKKHQALEAEINDCLAHPGVDDLRIVELKRRKLFVKDQIERLRHGEAVH